uniref:Uncharacterized protein n=1 Tax=Pseudo-nitzschia australis TaxID=44445 RepID=A0A7S4AVE1_9STRA
MPPLLWFQTTARTLKSPAVNPGIAVATERSNNKDNDPGAAATATTPTKTAVVLQVSPSAASVDDAASALSGTTKSSSATTASSCALSLSSTSSLFVSAMDHHLESRCHRQRTIAAKKLWGAILRASAMDRVNDRGMWHAWTRSFDTPLLALLDLFNNAVDASWMFMPRNIHKKPVLVGGWKQQ